MKAANEKLRVVLFALTAAALFMTGLAVSPAAAQTDPTVDGSPDEAGEVSTEPARLRPRGEHRARPDEFGPWKVGLETFEMVDADRDDRTMEVDIWYPIDAEVAATADPAVIDFLVASLTFENTFDAPPPARVGNFPLVVFSHGSGGIRQQSWDLMEHLASHGFVVVAPDHTGNTALDGLNGTVLPGDVVAAHRPRDISFVIDQVLGFDADPTNKFAGQINERKIAVAGHSFGGFTALAVAGGFDTYEPDPRVKAIIPIAGASNGLTDEELAAIDVPTLFLSATDDVTVALDPGTTRPWAEISSNRIYRVDLLSAGHSSFTNICDLVDLLLDGGLPPVLLQALIDNAAEGCAPELMNIDEALRLTNLYSTAFLKVALNSVGKNRFYLTPRYTRNAENSVDYFVGNRRGRTLRYQGPPPPLGS